MADALERQADGHEHKARDHESTCSSSLVENRDRWRAEAAREWDKADVLRSVVQAIREINLQE